MGFLHFPPDISFKSLIDFALSRQQPSITTIVFTCASRRVKFAHEFQHNIRII
jgi:hypothetical protein